MPQNVPTYRVIPEPGGVVACDDLLTHALANWQPQASLPIVEMLIPQWPADDRDRLRYLLGLYYALDGEPPQAVRTLEDLIANPTTADSQWIAPAQDFLAAYQSPAALYRACQSVPLCDLRAAMRRLAASSGVSDPSLALDYLQRNGVSTRSSGYFDFDGDSQEERWLVLRPQPDQQLEFWILAGSQALFVTLIEDGSPQPYTNQPPVAQLERGKGFILHRAADGTAYLEHVTVEFTPNTFTRDALDAAQEALFSGTDPKAVRLQLEWTMADPRFNCKNYRICDRFYYTLALAHELAGEGRAAVDTYLKLWWENLRSPFTIMARLKMIQFPPGVKPSVTPTPEPTGTETATATQTSTLTATP